MAEFHVEHVAGRTVATLAGAVPHRYVMVRKGLVAVIPASDDIADAERYRERAVRAAETAVIT